jgi:two-component system NtrC family response regulator
LQYPFPGNIREMENIIDGIIAEAEREVITDNLPLRILKPATELSLKLIDVENSHIKKVLVTCNKNKQQACRVLGISINTLEKRISDYHLIADL